MAGGSSECDDRCSAIEVQIAEEVKLREHLMAIVMPTHYLDDISLKQILIQEWRAYPLTYDADDGMRPTEFHGHVRSLIKAYYKTWRFA